MAAQVLYPLSHVHKRQPTEKKNVQEKNQAKKTSPAFFHSSFTLPPSVPALFHTPLLPCPLSFLIRNARSSSSASLLEIGAWSDVRFIFWQLLFFLLLNLKFLRRPSGVCSYDVVLSISLQLHHGFVCPFLWLQSWHMLPISLCRILCSLSICYVLEMISHLAHMVSKALLCMMSLRSSLALRSQHGSILPCQLFVWHHRPLRCKWRGIWSQLHYLC